jgi:ATP phosphoribosyltransferase regulatory subunit
MADKAAARATGARYLDAFRAAGATEVDADILQPAEALLDLYGEDIRARAYVTSDPLRGEMMLRPDFTVPVVQAHMAHGADPARYCYLGEVFRKQDHRGPRVAEYFQAGFEVFDRADPEAADAEVFALFADLLAPLSPSATIGDISLLRDAVAGLNTLESRKSALQRHIWRPRRFHALLERYAGQTPVPASRTALLSGPETSDAPWIGLRDPEEMQDRITALRADAAAAPLSAEDVAGIDALIAIKAPAPEALAALQALTTRLPAIAQGVSRLHRRLAAMKARGVDLETVTFDASLGRATMEYYDGFVFTLTAANPALPPLATGGRYDALTRVLGQGRSIPAVGGVIRPGVIADLEASA